MPRIGLQLPRKLTYDKWLSIGHQLASISSSAAWCLGDWLIYGETAFSGRYREAIERTSLEYQTLRNYAWVARHFSVSRRRDTLSFAHHAEVVALSEPEQDFWLRKAAEFHWSVKQLRRELRSSLRERSEGDGRYLTPDSSDRVVRLQIHVSAEQLETCKAAADDAGLSVEEWAVLALNWAVRRIFVSSQQPSPGSDDHPPGQQRALSLSIGMLRRAGTDHRTGSANWTGLG